MSRSWSSADIKTGRIFLFPIICVDLLISLRANQKITTRWAVTSRLRVTVVQSGRHLIGFVRWRHFRLLLREYRHQRMLVSQCSMGPKGFWCQITEDGSWMVFLPPYVIMRKVYCLVLFLSESPSNQVFTKCELFLGLLEVCSLFHKQIFLSWITDWSATRDSWGRQRNWGRSVFRQWRETGNWCS